MKINIDFIYPVGSIYMSTNNVNPQTLFGGSWSKIEGRFLLGSSSSYTLGSVGGEATHTLTTNEMPSHNHGSANGGGFIVTGSGESANVGYGSNFVLSWGTSSSGGSQPHNNMPPYQVVNIWKRTA